MAPCTLDKAIQDLGFTATKTDPCMYTLQVGGEYCILTLYVDDILITSPDMKFLTRIKKKLMERFTMSDLGEVSLILGLKITRDRVKKPIPCLWRARQLLCGHAIAHCIKHNRSRNGGYFLRRTRGLPHSRHAPRAGLRKVLHSARSRSETIPLERYHW